MPLKPTRNTPRKYIQSGPELRAWRQAVGLRTDEMAELIGMGRRSVIRAEAAAVPSPRVLERVHVLEDRLLEGRLDINPLIRRRAPQGRAKNRES